MSSSNRTRRRDTKRPYAVVLAGAAVFGLLLLAGLTAIRMPNGTPGVSYKTYAALVPDPGNLQPHNDVRIGGVRVGQIINVEPQDGQARVELKLGGDTEALPRDTQVFVRAQGLLGARYLELAPGKSDDPLPEGGTLRGTARSLTYGLPDALNTFDPPTREAVGTTLDGLGTGLLGRGRGLGDALAAAPEAGDEFERALDAIIARRGSARRLAPALESMTRGLSASREEQAALLPAARRGLQPLADAAPALRATLDEAPPTLSAVRQALPEGRRLLASARSLSESASDVLPVVPAGLRATTALLRSGRVPLQRTAALLRVVAATTPSVRRVVREADQLLVPARRLFDDIRPVLDAITPYGCDVDNFAENWRSALGYGVDTRAQANPLPSGFVGPLTFFRILPSISSKSFLEGAQMPDRTFHGEPYPQPCKYSPGPSYVVPTQLGQGGR